MTAERALDIIAAYGADRRRWPADEREALTLVAIADPAVAAALAEARAMDALLAGWAGDVAPAAPLDAAMLIPAPATRAAPQRRWWAGAAVAAAVAALIAVRVPFAAIPGAPPVEVATVAANVSPVPSAAGESQDLADAEAFATVFTPTADEDQLI